MLYCFLNFFLSFFLARSRFFFFSLISLLHWIRLESMLFFFFDEELHYQKLLWYNATIHVYILSKPAEVCAICNLYTAWHVYFLLQNPKLKILHNKNAVQCLSNFCVLKFQPALWSMDVFFQPSSKYIIIVP